MKIAFLDRDGTIVKDYPDEEWKHHKHPELIPEAIDALKALQGIGYSFMITTNQYLIDEGFISYNDYQEFTKKMIELYRSYGIEFLEIFYCPHSRLTHCHCRKPQTGMFEIAFKKYPALQKCMVIGDSKCDMEAAINIRANGIAIHKRAHMNHPSIHNLKSIGYIKSILQDL
ncbi:MAG: HAD-IIIA family hydrolase [bacterium]|jgi:D-glycero-D-manno-heptose 1,7-bisphosphate phosphatase